MDHAQPLQLILPTDKRNPCFSLYLDDEERNIHVYYGLELLEVIPNDPEHSAYILEWDFRANRCACSSKISRRRSVVKR